jgi:transcriptional regulator with XRE-family HTH domain
MFFPWPLPPPMRSLLHDLNTKLYNMQLAGINRRHIHEGRNVKRIREMLGVKQEALAIGLGLTQQAVSQLEQKEMVDREIFEKIAGLLGVPSDAIRNYSEETAINVISNNYHHQSSSISYYPSFNFLQKWLEVLEENRKLYRQLVEAEKSKAELLRKLLGDVK